MRLRHRRAAEELRSDGEVLLEQGQIDVVEREPDAAPVAARAQPFELAEDPLLVGVLPLPDPFDEGFAADIVPGFALLFEQSAFDD